MEDLQLPRAWNYRDINNLLSAKWLLFIFFGFDLLLSSFFGCIYC